MLGNIRFETIEAAQVIMVLIKLPKEMRETHRSGEDLGLKTEEGRIDLRGDG